MGIKSELRNFIGLQNSDEEIQIKTFKLSGIHFDMKAKIGEMEANTFQGFLFEEIIIRLASIKTIHPDAFSDNIYHTRKIVINNCGLSSHSHNHHNHQDAHHVDDTSVSIYEPLSIFSRFTKLEELDLSSNNLTFIPDNVFSRRQLNLRVIKLSFNKIHTINSFAFSGLSNLRILKLDTNHIHKIGANALFPVIDNNLISKGEEIVDSNINQISLIIQDTEITLTDYNRERSIIRINLFNNHLTTESFDNQSFSLLKTPIHLKMNFNQMTDIPEDVFKPVLTNHGSVELFKNKINCGNCHGISNWILNADANRKFCQKCSCYDGSQFYSQTVSDCNRR